jgi:hypothetical protein
MPGIREAIEQGQWDSVNGQITRVADALTREASLVTQLAEALGAAR